MIRKVAVEGGIVAGIPAADPRPDPPDELMRLAAEAFLNKK